MSGGHNLARTQPKADGGVSPLVRGYSAATGDTPPALRATFPYTGSNHTPAFAAGRARIASAQRTTLANPSGTSNFTIREKSSPV